LLRKELINFLHGGAAIVRDSVAAYGKSFNNYEGSTRAYGTLLTPESIKHKGSTFYEWFGGFTDAEGTFY
jgi:hypothetical protein